MTIEIPLVDSEALKAEINKLQDLDDEQKRSLENRWLHMVRYWDQRSRKFSPFLPMEPSRGVPPLFLQKAHPEACSLGVCENAVSFAGFPYHPFCGVCRGHNFAAA